MKKGFLNSIRTKVTVAFIVFSILLAAIVYSFFNNQNFVGALRGTAFVIGSETLQGSTLMFFFIIVLVMFAFGFGLFFSKKITSPIKDLELATKELQKRNFNTRVQINTGDEFEDLGNSFNQALFTLSKVEKERKKLERAKTEFLSITSHELRTPMTPIRTQLKMLCSEYFGKLTPKQKNSIKIILNSTDRLNEIIEDFLEISRIEAARLKFNFQNINLTNTLNSIIKEMKAFMPEKNIAILSRIDKIPIIKTDPHRIEQILTNLLSNAIKFTPRKGKIELIVTPKENHLLFCVKDSGIGVSKQDQQRLFEPFFQADQNIYTRQDGTGLGLAIVKGIVESQGGKIWLESILGKGSSFFFTVPFVPRKQSKPIKILFSAKDINSNKNKI